MKRVNLLLLGIWLLVIFCFSNNTGDVSQMQSDGIVHVVVEFVNQIADHSFTEGELKTCSLIVRKTAHFLEYLILGILIYRVFQDYYVVTRKELLWIFLACVFYAAIDEFHQLFVDGRAGQILDVFIDSMGSITGIFLYHLRPRKKNS